MPYAWTITAGVLPAGLVLNSANGVISGTPTPQHGDLYHSGGGCQWRYRERSVRLDHRRESRHHHVNAAASGAWLDLIHATGGYRIGRSLHMVHTGSLPTGLSLSSGGVIWHPRCLELTPSRFKLPMHRQQLHLDIHTDGSAGSGFAYDSIALRHAHAAATDSGHGKHTKGVPGGSGRSVDVTVHPESRVADRLICRRNSAPGAIRWLSRFRRDKPAPCFSQPQLALQRAVSSVAGSIVLTADITAGGASLTLSNNPEVTLTVPQSAPGISSVTIRVIFRIQRGSGRLLQHARDHAGLFHLRRATGSQIQTATASTANEPTLVPGAYR